MTITADRARAAVILAAICGGACCLSALGQEASEPASRTAPPEPPAQPDIVVQGQTSNDLRLQIRRAEEAVFARFNELNSTDDFDIHCRSEAVTGTRVRSRSCQSNSWREQDANIAQAVLARIRGEAGAPPGQFQGEQLVMQQRLAAEVRRLALEDEELGDAVLQVGEARAALAERTGGRDEATRWRQVSADAGGLPYDAERMFEVRIMGEPWWHLLSHRTFTIARVTGDIRSLTLSCRDGDTLQTDQLEFAADAEWTLPSTWTSCLLGVRAKKGTTFALFEF